MNVEMIIIIAVIIALIVAAIILAATGHTKVVKRCLKYICAEAEHDFGSGTGELKLEAAFDAFSERFPLIASIITKKRFRKWVDTALITVNKWLGENESIAAVLTENSIELRGTDL